MQETESEISYWKFSISIPSVREIKQALTEISLEVTSLLYIYSCYLQEFVAAQNALRNSVEKIEVQFNKTSDYERMCILKGNQIVRSESCRAMATSSVEALSTVNFKSQAEALSLSTMRLQESVTILLAYQAEMQTKIEFLKMLSVKYSAAMSEFITALNLLIARSSSYDIHCIQKKL
mmetsp:Transcript_31969/g.46040  ORF Transcript_31969/g.46040 Transcript_31969/m.46040 type:complete len:178 (-) Transcript_31969:1205-1738(-)